MRISDWSSDVCSSDLVTGGTPTSTTPLRRPGVTRRAAHNRRNSQWRKASAEAAKSHASRRRPLCQNRTPPILPKRAWLKSRRNGSPDRGARRSEDQTSDLKSLMRIPYDVLSLKKNNKSAEHTKYIQSH